MKHFKDFSLHVLYVVCNDCATWWYLYCLTIVMVTKFFDLILLLLLFYCVLLNFIQNYSIFLCFSFSASCCCLTLLFFSRIILGQKILFAIFCEFASRSFGEERLSVAQTPTQNTRNESVNALWCDKKKTHIK